MLRIKIKDLPYYIKNSDRFRNRDISKDFIVIPKSLYNLNPTNKEELEICRELNIDKVPGHLIDYLYYNKEKFTCFEREVNLLKDFDNKRFNAQVKILNELDYSGSYCMCSNPFEMALERKDLIWLKVNFSNTVNEIKKIILVNDFNLMSLIGDNTESNYICFAVRNCCINAILYFQSKRVRPPNRLIEAAILSNNNTIFCFVYSWFIQNNIDITCIINLYDYTISKNCFNIFRFLIDMNFKTNNLIGKCLRSNNVDMLKYAISNSNSSQEDRFDINIEYNNNYDCLLYYIKYYYTEFSNLDLDNVKKLNDQKSLSLHKISLLVFAAIMESNIPILEYISNYYKFTDKDIKVANYKNNIEVINFITSKESFSVRDPFILNIEALKIVVQDGYKLNKSQYENIKTIEQFDLFRDQLDSSILEIFIRNDNFELFVHALNNGITWSSSPMLFNFVIEGDSLSLDKIEQHNFIYTEPIPVPNKCIEYLIINDYEMDLEFYKKYEEAKSLYNWKNHCNLKNNLINP